MSIESMQIFENIQAASPDDFQEIVDVWEASVRATHHFLKEEDIQYFKPLILNEFLQAVNLFCIRNERGHIVGFLGTVKDKIEMLFIDPFNIEKGVGKLLLHYAISQLGAKKVDVNEDNHQAVDFYKHMGFQVVSRSDVDSMGKPYPILSMELVP
ncbi:GNAT family N-acetyltransferase [Flavisolibacter tropicus]|nr:GNAT family N-acetyltransferase [Flavisolibacter tropicus]